VRLSYSRADCALGQGDVHTARARGDSGMVAGDDRRLVRRGQCGGNLFRQLLRSMDSAQQQRMASHRPCPRLKDRTGRAGRRNRTDSAAQEPRHKGSLPDEVLV